MALLDVNRFAAMPEEERLDLIAALVAKAVAHFKHGERPAGKNVCDAPSVGAAPTLDVSELVSDEIEKQMLRYLARVGFASPVTFKMVLGLSRQTVTRKLRHLRTTGVVVVVGKTRLARYELAASSLRN